MNIDFTDLRKAKTRDVRRLARWLKIPGVWRLKAYRLRCIVDDRVSELRHYDRFGATQYTFY